MLHAGWRARGEKAITNRFSCRTPTRVRPQNPPASLSPMIVENGGPLVDRDEAVLFAFDDHSIAHSQNARLRMIGYTSRPGKVAVPLGPAGSVDDKMVNYLAFSNTVDPVM